MGPAVDHPWDLLGTSAEAPATASLSPWKSARRRSSYSSAIRLFGSEHAKIMRYSEFLEMPNWVFDVAKRSPLKSGVIMWRLSYDMLMTHPLGSWVKIIQHDQHGSLEQPWSKVISGAAIVCLCLAMSCHVCLVYPNHAVDGCEILHQLVVYPMFIPWFIGFLHLSTIPGGATLHSWVRLASPGSRRHIEAIPAASWRCKDGGAARPQGSPIPRRCRRCELRRPLHPLHLPSFLKGKFSDTLASPVFLLVFCVLLHLDAARSVKINKKMSPSQSSCKSKLLTAAAGIVACQDHQDRSGVGSSPYLALLGPTWSGCVIPVIPGGWFCGVAITSRIGCLHHALPSGAETFRVRPGGCWSHQNLPWSCGVTKRMWYNWYNYSPAQK